MSSVFRLKSDNEFITPDGDGVFVYSYKGDMNGSKILQATHLSDDHWGAGAYVAATAEQYTALEVFGVAIAGDRLKELVNELHAMETGGMYIFVNRLGLCLITELDHPRARSMRINDCFGWSHYGVVVPQSEMVASTAAVWNKLDMSNGETVMDVGQLARAAEEVELLRRSLGDKDVELTASKKETEGKIDELAACKKELEDSKKMVSVLNKLVEAKEMEVGMMKNQLLGFQATLQSMASLKLPYT